jgi:hypothetical protein
MPGVWDSATPRKADLQCWLREGEILTDSLQVVNGLHVGRAHLYKGVADLVQHLSEKRKVRSGERQ